MRIVKMQTKVFWKGETGVEGTVEDQGRQYLVRLEVRGSEINSSSCSCGSGSSCRGLCPHEKALFDYYEKWSEGAPDRPISTSAQVRTMIREYTNREVASIAERETEEPVHLVPRLLVLRQDIRVEFRIGRTRYYVVRDLVAFSDALENGSYVEYGKALAFYHSRDAFDEESRRLLDMVEEVSDAYRENYMEFRKSFYAASPAMREMNLTRVRRDRFFDLLAGREIEAEDAQGRKKNVRVRQENPEIAVNVERAGSRGIRVSLDKGLLTFMGEKHLYVIRGSDLYQCTESFSRQMEVFFQQMTQGYGAPYEVLVNEKDVPLFYERVLKKLESYGMLRTRDVDWETYRPVELKARFVLESPDPNTVILRPTLSYGNFSFHPMEDEHVPAAISRDVPGEFRISQVLTKYFKYREPGSNDLMIRDDEAAVYRLVSEGIGELKRLGEVWLPEDMSHLRMAAPKEVSVGLQAAGGWLTLTVDAGDLNGSELSEILEAYREKRSYYRLKSGEFLRLEDNGLMTVARMVEGMDVPKKDRTNHVFQAPAYRALYLDSLYRERRDLRLERNARFKSIVRGMRAIEDSDFELPEGFDKILRGYQKVGYRWLRTLDFYGFGGILADDMGLGKTVQIISLLYDESRKEKCVSLIVCPASLVYNWECEIQKFAPSLRVLLVTGSAPEREERLKQLPDYEVVVTSYDLLKRDLSFYQGTEFRFQVIDEAQYIKNPTTQSARAVKAVKARTRFALTGTPIENRLSELWSIFDFLMPGFLYSYQRFKERFESPIVREGSEEAMELLRRMTAPFLLRRLKKDVLKELPEKLETVVYSQMEPEQKELYAARALQLKERLEGGAQESKIQILAALTRLRQVCCDPRLVYEDYKGSSAKLETCMELLNSGVESGYQILLFSQFTSMLELIRKRLDEAAVPYFLLTGATPKEERLRLVNAFQKGEAPVFLISLKAGGTGLNLTAADLVIHYDPWWNVAAQNQATDRAHRIGQEKTVTVVQLITKGTIEENILKLQKAKASLAEQVVTDENVSLGSLSYEEILGLLE